MPILPRQDLDHIFSHTKAFWENLRGRSVFLTGGTGFVGIWLLESLLWACDNLDLGANITVLTRNPAHFRESAPHLADHPAVRLLRGSAENFEFPEGEFPFIIHAATERSFEPDSGRPLSTFDANIEGTRRVLEFARRHGVRRFLFTSSGAVYGQQPTGMSHIAEEYVGAPLAVDTESAYGQAKRVSEFMSTMYSRVYGFDSMIARLFAFVGPHLPLDANFAVGNFIRDALKGGPVNIAGDGTPFRSYLYAADLAVWLWTILFVGQSRYPYNVGSDIAVTISELAHEVAKQVIPRPAVLVAKQPVPGYAPLRYIPAVDRANRDLGLAVRIGLTDGIHRTLLWHVKYHRYTCHIAPPVPFAFDTTQKTKG